MVGQLRELQALGPQRVVARCKLGKKRPEIVRGVEHGRALTQRLRVDGKARLSGIGINVLECQADRLACEQIVKQHGGIVRDERVRAGKKFIGCDAVRGEEPVVDEAQVAQLQCADVREILRRVGLDDHERARLPCCGIYGLGCCRVVDDGDGDVRRCDEVVFVLAVGGIPDDEAVKLRAEDVLQVAFVREQVIVAREAERDELFRWDVKFIAVHGVKKRGLTQRPVGRRVAEIVVVHALERAAVRQVQVHGLRPERLDLAVAVHDGGGAGAQRKQAHQRPFAMRADKADVLFVHVPEYRRIRNDPYEPVPVVPALGQQLTIQGAGVVAEGRRTLEQDDRFAGQQTQQMHKQAF